MLAVTDGGMEAAGNEVSVRTNGAWKDDFPNAKVLTTRIKAGDAFAVRSGGGGGFGSPLERPAEAVARDVRQGYVSAAAARDRRATLTDEP